MPPTPPGGHAHASESPPGLWGRFSHSPVFNWLCDYGKPNGRIASTAPNRNWGRAFAGGYSWATRLLHFESWARKILGKADSRDGLVQLV